MVIAWLMLAVYLVVGLLVGSWLDAAERWGPYRAIPPVAIVLIGAMWLPVLLASVTIYCFDAVAHQGTRR